MWVCSSCGSAEPDTTIVDVTFLPQQLFDVAVTTWYQRPRLLFEVPTPPLFPLLMALHSNMDKINQHRFSLSHFDRSGLVWTGRVLSGAVQSSCPIFRDSLVHWPDGLLIQELFDMHVCFYRFPSMLLCVGHAMPHLMKETEQLLCWTAES